MADPIIINSFTWSGANGSPVFTDNGTADAVVNLDTTYTKTEQARTNTFTAERRNMVIEGNFEGVNDNIDFASDNQTFYVGLQKETSPGSGVWVQVPGGGGEVNGADALSGSFRFDVSNIEPGQNYRIGFGEGDAGDAEPLYLSDVTVTMVCFAASTMIRTIDGYKKINELSVGDLVWTMDNGYKPIRWIGSRHIDEHKLGQNPKLVPVAIKPHNKNIDGSFDELLVSQQHRMLLGAPMNKRSNDSEQVLVPAKKLLEFNNFRLADEVKEVTYFHLMFDEHEVIDANGIMAESFYPGDEAMNAISQEQKDEFNAIFPDLDMKSFPFSREVPCDSDLMNFFKEHYVNRNHMHLYYTGK